MQFDLFGGLADRNDAYERMAARQPEWFKAALFVIIALPHGWQGLGEDIREVIEEKVGPPATSTNCYGALTARAISLGVLKRTGRRLPMKKRTSHGRKTDEYLRA